MSDPADKHSAADQGPQTRAGMTGPSTDSLFRLLAERVSGTLDFSVSTFRLAAAETRLAASSAGLILALGALCVAVVLVSWLLLMALLGLGLHLLGLPPAAVVGLLLVLHLGALGALGFTIVRLSRHLALPHTREALQLRRTLIDKDGADPRGQGTSI